MERRTKLIILIVIAAVLIGIGVWYLVQPFLPTSPSGTTSDAKNAIPKRAQPITKGSPEIATSTAATSNPSSLFALEKIATGFVARMGTGSSENGFAGYDDVLVNCTPEFQATLRTLRAKLQTDHPRDTAYGVTTRVVSVSTTDEVEGAATVTARVTVQVAEDAGNPGKPTSVSYRRISVVFQKQATGGYLISDATSEEMAR